MCLFRTFVYFVQKYVRFRGKKKSLPITADLSYTFFLWKQDYIIPANTDAPTTVSRPATAMARLLMAPPPGPSSITLAVQMAWAEAPRPRPLAIGSSIFAIL